MVGDISKKRGEDGTSQTKCTDSLSSVLFCAKIKHCEICFCNKRGVALFFFLFLKIGSLSGKMSGIASFVSKEFYLFFRSLTKQYPLFGK